MAAPESVLRLVERFERNCDEYRASGYNEAQVRQEFIDPLFAALGWDIDNSKGAPEAYKEVVHEDAIRIGGAHKAPDYSFRAEGSRKFFVEAKKPSVNLRNDVTPAFQLRRYAWSAKLPLSVLTDFEEFVVYDTRVRPAKDDSAATARLRHITYDTYPEHWDEISEHFSREAVYDGAFDRYAEETATKRGTATVDTAFLKEIEEWRLLLARNITLRNPGLSQRELNFAVQMTIDRIIFLRMAEDRGIETYGRLLALRNGGDVYARLRDLYRQADERYNSGLFHFQPERGRDEQPDRLTPGLSIDDKPLKDIFRDLYYPDSPYEFAVLPVDVLGQVYEQFLGKVIRLTPGRRVQVEEKPEVRKAGGVYYTPTYIVDYIVEHTVGKLLEGKTPRQASRLKIVDPACGSGSFLIGAYQCLLDWHRDYYVADGPDKHPKELYESIGGEWRLTTAERKRVLLNNIYGVDIDQQAVEVTKLSLLLKQLEGATDQSIVRQAASQLQFAYKERVLPDLSANIKCGNSLIGPDFYDNQQMTFLDAAEHDRINVFDWQASFPTVFSGANPGFDAVIGNPPYGFHQIHSEYVKWYFKARYAASQGSFEHYFLFYELSLGLLRSGGLHGFIVPVTWLTIPSAASLRTFVLNDFAIRSIAWLPELVFKNAQVNTLVSIIERARPGTIAVIISDVNDPTRAQGVKREVDQASFVQSGNVIHIFEDQRETELLTKIEGKSVPLSTLARPCSGYNPYEVGKGTSPSGRAHTKETVTQRPYHSSMQLGVEWKPEAVGRDLGRYALKWPTERFVKYGPWLAAARDPENFVGPRLLVQEITGGQSRRIIATFCDQDLYYSRDIIPVKCDRPLPSPLYLLGIINSWLITWRHHRRSPKARKALFPKVLVGDLKSLPIRTIDFDDPADVARHDQMVGLVERMLALNEQSAAARTSHDKTLLQRQIEATDRQIDRLVYELYELTDDEIRIVEEVATGSG